jgi:hypothetical protein
VEYECSYNPNLNAVEAATSGTADVTALIELVHRISALCDQQRSANILVDHSQVDATPLTMRDVETLSRTMVACKETFQGRKCAHVVAKDLQFGLVRAWEAMIEIHGLTELETGLFTDRGEAIAWVRPAA